MKGFIYGGIYTISHYANRYFIYLGKNKSRFNYHNFLMIADSHNYKLYKEVKSMKEFVNYIILHTDYKRLKRYIYEFSEDRFLHSYDGYLGLIDDEATKVIGAL